MSPDEIRKTIKEERERQGLSFYRVSKWSGLNIETPKAIEDGQDVRLETLHTLCEALGIELKLVITEDRER